MDPNSTPQVDASSERKPMLFTEGQRNTYAHLHGEARFAKEQLADALEAVTKARETLASAEASRNGYVRGLILERNLPGQWAVAPDGTALIPR